MSCQSLPAIYSLRNQSCQKCGNILFSLHLRLISMLDKHVNNTMFMFCGCGVKHNLSSDLTKAVDTTCCKTSIQVLFWSVSQ